LQLAASVFFFVGFKLTPSVGSVFWAIDPYGLHYLFPYILVSLLSGIIYSHIFVIFFVILFYWIEFYRLTVLALKEDEMVKKVNSVYTHHVSVDDIIQRVRFIRKMKYPLAVVVALGVSIELAADAISGIGKFCEILNVC
jgi:hypothetical protein